MPRVRDVAYIRKLCALPLPAPALAQALLPALRRLVPAHSGGVFWVDEHGEMTSLYAERLLPPAAMAVYYERHYQAAKEGFVAAFRRRAGAPDPVSSHSFAPGEQASAYFRDVLRPLDAYHVLYGVLRHDARPCAQISLYRGRADRPFSERDAATLRSLLRYLASGLSRTAVAAGGDEASVAVEEAVGVVALDGTPLSASAQWQRMLRLLVLNAVSPRAARTEEAAIGAYLRAICAELARDTAAWRERVHDSAAGRHVVRAWRLAPATAGGPEGMALLLRREEPRSVALLRGTAAAGLSPQQCEVALLLAEGLTNQAIAQQLSLSLNTAGYHVKQVHARLGVNDRNAVQARLLALGRSAAGS